jgi:hypothetical protein
MVAKRKGGRPGLLPPLGMKFKDALAAFLSVTPPDKAAEQPKGKRKRKTKRR